jgi:AcrR family transcriptional regulator
MTLADGPPPLNPVVRGRSTRDRPPKPPLSFDAVVDAALTILQAEGVEAVTMRRVARALDTGAASLYVYVPNREGLLVAMLDRVTGSIELEEPDPSCWRAQLHSLLLRLYQALTAHPGIAALTVGDPPTTETVLLVAENLFGILLAGGVDTQDAAWACDIFTMLTTAAAAEEDVRRSPGHSFENREERVEDLRRMFGGLATERFPLISAHADEMLAGDAEERFAFGIDLVVDGVVARAARRR